MVGLNLSELELRVLDELAFAVKDLKFRNAFRLQVTKLSVKSRTEKTFGYYVDFFIKDHVWTPDLIIGDEFNLEPPCVVGYHSEVEGCIFFLAYVKNGFIDFLESSATDHWPLNEERIVLGFS